MRHFKFLSAVVSVGLAIAVCFGVTGWRNEVAQATSTSEEDQDRREIASLRAEVHEWASEEDQDRREIALLRAEVDRLMGRVVALELQRTDTRIAATDLTESATSEPQRQEPERLSPAMRGEALAVEQARKEAATRAVFEEKLAQEARDRSWADVFEQGTHALFADANRTQVAHVSCRTTVCKIELISDSREARDAAEPKLALGLPSHGQDAAFYSESPDGRFLTSFYVMRIGSLP